MFRLKNLVALFFLKSVKNWLPSAMRVKILMVNHCMLEPATNKVSLRNVVRCEKYKPVKFANFVYFCITLGKLILLSRKWYQFSVL